MALGELDRAKRCGKESNKGPFTLGERTLITIYLRP